MCGVSVTGVEVVGDGMVVGGVRSLGRAMRRDLMGSSDEGRDTTERSLLKDWMWRDDVFDNLRDRRRCCKIVDVEVSGSVLLMWGGNWGRKVV